MIFEVLNVDIDIKNVAPNKDLQMKQIIENFQAIEPYLGKMLLLSNGRLIRGENFSLITNSGYLDISQEKENIFTINKNANRTTSTKYYFVNDTLYTGEYKKIIPTGEFQNLAFPQYYSPVFILNALYIENNIQEIALLKRNQIKLNEEKVNFLEDILNFSLKNEEKYLKLQKETKNKMNPLLVADKLKFLEEHYYKVADEYAQMALPVNKIKNIKKT